MSCLRRLVTVQPCNMWFAKQHAQHKVCSAVIIYCEPRRYLNRPRSRVPLGPKRKSSRKTTGSPLALHMQMIADKSKITKAPSGVVSIGEELTGIHLSTVNIQHIMNDFTKQRHLKDLCAENGLENERVRNLAMDNFRKVCVNGDLSVELHVIMADIMAGKDHVDSIFPYFLEHARSLFPFIESMEDMKLIGDLTQPAEWYPEARKMKRKIIMHVGPTNSGKTYHALERLKKAKSGVYCGPLRLLAMEIHQKLNNDSVPPIPCDLVTGESRRFAIDPDTPASHVSCTVEMTNISKPCEVAVIDEIQMIADLQRGFAWTRALLGVPAEEVHVCGEPSSINLVKDLMAATGDTFEVRKYKRLNDIKVLGTALGSLNNVQAGDCIVCFSRDEIFRISHELEIKGHEVAVIYGGLPAATKLAQAARFNDPSNQCNVLVATDAIGMGLNLSIKRVIFNTIEKITLTETGKTEMQDISTSLALQIGGRAGRHGSQYEFGLITTLHRRDLAKLHHIIGQDYRPITQAGLNPSLEQLELFSYHLPKAGLSDLMDMFVEMCMMDNSLYFMCNLEAMKDISHTIQHIDLTLREKHTLCCAPINMMSAFNSTMLIKIARRMSHGSPMTFQWLCDQLGMPFQQPKNIEDLLHLESVSDVIDLYLWLSMRFKTMFLYPDLVVEMQTELEQAIQAGLVKITKLITDGQKAPPKNSSRISQKDTQKHNVSLENVLKDVVKYKSHSRVNKKADNLEPQVEVSKPDVVESVPKPVSDVKFTKPISDVKVTKPTVGAKVTKQTIVAKVTKPKAEVKSIKSKAKVVVTKPTETGEEDSLGDLIYRYAEADSVKTFDTNNMTNDKLDDSSKDFSTTNEQELNDDTKLTLKLEEMMKAISVAADTVGKEVTAKQSEEITDTVGKKLIAKKTEEITDTVGKKAIAKKSEEITMITDTVGKKLIAKKTEEITDTVGKKAIAKKSEEITDTVGKKLIAKKTEEITDTVGKKAIAKKSEDLEKSDTPAVGIDSVSTEAVNERHPSAEEQATKSGQDDKTVVVTTIVSPLMANNFINDFTKRSIYKQEESNPEFEQRVYLMDLADSLIAPPVVLQTEAYDTVHLEDFTDSNISASTSRTETLQTNNSASPSDKMVAGMLCSNENADYNSAVETRVNETSQTSLQFSRMYENQHESDSVNESNLEKESMFESNIEKESTGMFEQEVEKKSVSESAGLAKSTTLADTLISQGLLTRERLAELHAEWAKGIRSDTDDESVKK